jgi:hypothetical protein
VRSEHTFAAAASPSSEMRSISSEWCLVGEESRGSARTTSTNNLVRLKIESCTCHGSYPGVRSGKDAGTISC